MQIVKLYPGENSKFHFGYLGLDNEDYIFHSDSLFSTIVINYTRKYEERNIETFVSKFPLISSLFYGIKNKKREEVLFIPPNFNFNFRKLSEEDRKIHKKVKFVSIRSLIDENITTNKNKTLVFTNDDNIDNNAELFSSFKEEKVCIDRSTGVAEEGKLYNVTYLKPLENVFFYFLVNGSIDNELKESINLIKNFGIGGEISCGGGVIKDIKIEQLDLLNNLRGNLYTNLSIVLVDKGEVSYIEKYGLIERKGWIYGEQKRKTSLVGIREGSIFKQKIEGKIFKEKIDDKTIYRYGKAFLLPVGDYGNR